RMVVMAASVLRLSFGALLTATSIGCRTPPSMTQAPAPATASAAAVAADAPSGDKGLHVVGNRLVDGSKTGRLLGGNISGTENYCEQGIGVFQAPHDASLVAPMKAWGINTIRVPLNEDCWLGINGVQPQYGGSAYQQAIKTFVDMLRSNGMYVVVDLHI